MREGEIKRWEGAQKSECRHIGRGQKAIRSGGGSEGDKRCLKNGIANEEAEGSYYRERVVENVKKLENKEIAILDGSWTGRETEG